MLLMCESIYIMLWVYLFNYLFIYDESSVLAYVKSSLWKKKEKNIFHSSFDSILLPEQTHPYEISGKFQTNFQLSKNHAKENIIHCEIWLMRSLWMSSPVTQILDEMSCDGFIWEVFMDTRWVNSMLKKKKSTV